MKNIFIAIVALMITLSGNSQNSNLLNNKDGNWALLTSIEGGVLINYKIAECRPAEGGVQKEEVYLQFVNTTTLQISVSWELELKYGTKCYNCNGENDEMNFTKILAPLEKLEGVCGDGNPDQLRILTRYLGGESKTTLSDFNVKNIKLSVL